MNRRAPHESDLHKPLLFQKVGVFVDAENIELSGLKHHGGRTDYRRILEKIGDREIIRILYYKPIYKEISATFQSFWKGLGGEIKQPSKNADSFLIIDAVTLAEKMDVAIVLGGDKDYLPLVWYLKSRGCRVEIWSWPEATSPDVKAAADVYFPLTVDFVVPPEALDARPEARAAASPAEPRGGPADSKAGLAEPRPKGPVPEAKPMAPTRAQLGRAAASRVADSGKPNESALKPKAKGGRAEGAPEEPEAEPSVEAKAEGGGPEQPKKKRRRGSRGGRRRSGRERKKADGEAGPAEEESDSAEDS